MRIPPHRGAAIAALSLVAGTACASPGADHLVGDLATYTDAVSGITVDYLAGWSLTEPTEAHPNARQTAPRDVADTGADRRTGPGIPSCGAPPKGV